MAEIQGRETEEQKRGVVAHASLPCCFSALSSCLSALLPFCLATVFISGCVRTQAKITPDGPLEMPAPPSREVEPIESEAPPPVPLAQEPARSTPARPRPTPVPTREPSRTEAPKPEPAKPETQPVEPPKPLEDPQRPPTTLQTTPPTAEGEVERLIRAAISKANADLNRVDYRALNNDARNQYDTAKRFIRQADDAMRAKNLVFAKSVADKAAALAAQLAGR
jgi:outer membrane biosynthesis protein TonB